MGYMKGTGLEKVMRDLRIFRIFEGTNDILRLFVALTGIQFAGSHLKELQKAFKNPTANLGLILEEVTKRALSTVGFSSAPSLTHLVHPKLSNAANLAGQVSQDTCTLLSFTRNNYISYNFSLMLFLERRSVWTSRRIAVDQIRQGYYR